jgi:hypothetical protein
MLTIRIIVGAALAALGRKLFWFFVAAVGFVLAFSLASRLLNEDAGWLVWLIAIAAGLVGALLATSVQRLAIGLAGFLGGVLFALSLFEVLNIDAGGWVWLIYLASGILGAALISAVFDWALIILSSLTGAALIAQGLDLARGQALLVFGLAFLVGLIVQAGWLQADRRRSAG